MYIAGLVFALLRTSCSSSIRY